MALYKFVNIRPIFIITTTVMIIAALGCIQGCFKMIAIISRTSNYYGSACLDNNSRKVGILRLMNS